MEINDIIQNKRRMVQGRIEKSFGIDIEKARMAGDTKVKDGKTYVWTEYAPNKFDWRVVEKKNKKEQSTAAVKVPKGIKLVDEDSWVEIYDKNGKKIKEEYFADLGFDPNEKWNEKDGNYDIKGGGKMVVPKEGNSREEAKKEDKNEKADKTKLVSDVKQAFTELESEYDYAQENDDFLDKMLESDEKFYKKIGKLIKENGLDKDTFFKIQKSNKNWWYGFDADFDYIKENYAK